MMAVSVHLRLSRGDTAAVYDAVAATGERGRGRGREREGGEGEGEGSGGGEKKPTAGERGSSRLCSFLHRLSRSALHSL